MALLSASAPIAASGFPVLEAFNQGSLKVSLVCYKGPSLGTISILGIFANTSTTPISNFVFQAAVPKYWKLGLETASSQVLSPLCSDMTQNMTVVNSMLGEQPLMMRLRMTYEHNGLTVQESGEVNSLLLGL